MSSSNPTTLTSRPGSGRGLRARPELADGGIMSLADVVSIAYSVTELPSGSPATGSLTPSDVMFDSEQTPWDQGGGYTFQWQAPGSLWPTASKQYFVDVAFTCSDGLVYKHAWQVTTTAR